MKEQVLKIIDLELRAILSKLEIAKRQEKFAYCHQYQTQINAILQVRSQIELIEE